MPPEVTAGDLPPRRQPPAFEAACRRRPASSRCCAMIFAGEYAAEKIFTAWQPRDSRQRRNIRRTPAARRRNSQAAGCSFTDFQPKHFQPFEKRRDCFRQPVIRSRRMMAITPPPSLARDEQLSPFTAEPTAATAADTPPGFHARPPADFFSCQDAAGSRAMYGMAAFAAQMQMSAERWPAADRYWRPLHTKIRRRRDSQFYTLMLLSFTIADTVLPMVAEA